jgi:hypothetical protein
MHNIVSYNQLAGWETANDPDPDNDHENFINDYFECLVDCDDDQQVCKRLCKEAFY